MMAFPRGGRAMESPAPGEQQQQQSSTSRYKGVWLRKWGSWVAEVRIPNSRERLWLGSYPTPEQAARAFDTAVYCLRGPGAAFNFPDQLPHIPSAHKLSREEIKAAAMRFALEGPGRTGEAKEGGGEMTMEVVGEGEGNSWTMAGEAQEGGGAMTTEAVRPGEGLSGTMAEPVEALTEIDSTAGVWGRWDEEDECYWAAVHSGDDDIYRSSPLWNFPL